MTGQEWPDLSNQHLLGDHPIPRIVCELSVDSEAEFVWQNELGGLTFRIDDRFVKWNPRDNDVDLEQERVRLDWLSSRFPAPRVLAFGVEQETGAQWLVTSALPGEQAIGSVWRTRTAEAIQAIATGLRTLHAVSTEDFPSEWIGEEWFGRTPPAIGPKPEVGDPVIVHGDACAPNTLICPSGKWVGNVDVGSLGVGDRWADLAVASMSLDWNFGEGHQQAFFDAYEIAPDPVRIEYYRRLWSAES